MPTSVTSAGLSPDASAAVEFLLVLENRFGRGSWPETKKLLTSMVVSLTDGSFLTDKFSTFLGSWLNNIMQQNKHGKKHMKNNRRRILKTLLSELKHLACFTGGNGCPLKWDRVRVDAVVCCYKQLQTCARAAGATWAPAIVATKTSTQQVVTTKQKEVKTPVRQLRGHSIQVVETEHDLALAVQIILEKKQVEDEVMTVSKHVDGQSMTREGQQRNIFGYYDRVLAVDCEGVPDNLFMIQISNGSWAYIFDCVKLDPKIVCSALKEILTDGRTLKVFHDLHNDAAAFAVVGGVSEPLVGTFDSQIAMECISGELHMGFNKMLEKLGHCQHPSKTAIHKLMKKRAKELFGQRQLPSDVIEYAAEDVKLLMAVSKPLFEASWDKLQLVQQASDARASFAAKTGGARQVGFDVSKSYAMASLELLRFMKPDALLEPTPLKVSNDVPILLGLLPEDLSQGLRDPAMQKGLSDIVLDKGRKPFVWSRGARVFLGAEDRLVSKDDILSVVDTLGGFGRDNRAGLEQQLHRVSAIRNRQEEIIGLTMRVGRHVSGNATIIADLLFSDRTKSILFLGEPGSGKTTVVREVTRLLAERSNVVIVDTSNEIAGAGDIAHPCVGMARRMMVPSLNEQGSVMIECVQNHTPEVMVIDEIGRPEEVEAAKTCKQRGVRLIASAHGDLRKLIKNTRLRGMIGGVETVVVGDAQAKVEMKRRSKENPGSSGGGLRKRVAQRAGSPAFDIIVELRRGFHNEWRVVLDTARAVDNILEGRPYLAQRRLRNPQTGSIQLELEEA